MEEQTTWQQEMVTELEAVIDRSYDSAYEHSKRPDWEDAWMEAIEREVRLVMAFHAPPGTQFTMTVTARVAGRKRQMLVSHVATTHL